MGSTGGAATTLGIWYQTLGAGAALVNDWTKDWAFIDAGPIFHGESRIAAGEQHLQLILENFDMDAELHCEKGIALIQFKATSQQDASSFGLEEVRKILQNATKAILGHKHQNTNEPIEHFIVATNRDKGDCFTAIQETIKNLSAKNPSVNVRSTEFLAELAKESAPLILFSDQSSNVRTMLDFAQNVTRSRASNWGYSGQECAEACLKAIAVFAFASANPQRLMETLHKWFRTWGVLPSEEAIYTDSVLGTLVKESIDHRPCDKLSIMRRMFNSTSAIPINPRSVWHAVVKDLYDRRQDPPTRKLITENGPAKWLFDRSQLLRGLPNQYAEDPNTELNPEKEYFVNTNVPPRIIAIVGPGGTGKTSLLSRLFAQIADVVWDWDARVYSNEGKFIGYPIIAAPGKSAIEAVSGALKNWGQRIAATDYPINRFVAASKRTETEPAVWVALDGVDEIADANLSELANEIANWAYSNPNARFVLTCRPEQFRLMVNGLSEKGLMRQIRVEEFSPDEAWKALHNATNDELQIAAQPTRFASVGQMKDADAIVYGDPDGFEDSIRQPMFIGVIRRLYSNNGIKVIQDAYDGNPDALKRIATEYLYVFCERVQRRLSNAYVDARAIFCALKQLALDVNSPQEDNRSHWIKVCESQLGENVSWNKLYEQCAASGLIRKKNVTGSFEWRHPIVAKYLPSMEENPEWQ